MTILLITRLKNFASGPKCFQTQGLRRWCWWWIVINSILYALKLGQGSPTEPCSLKRRCSTGRKNSLFCLMLDITCALPWHLGTILKGEDWGWGAENEFGISFQEVMSEWSVKEQAGIIIQNSLIKSTPEYRVSKRYDMGVHGLPEEYRQFIMTAWASAWYIK